MKKQSRPIQAILNATDSTLHNTISRAQLLSHINLALQEILPVELAKNVSVMNVRDGTVIIGADNAALLTKLRFDSQNLLYRIKQIPGLANLHHIHFKVQTGHADFSTAPPRRVAMSSKTSELLQNAAEGFDDPGLKSALVRLSKNHPSTS